MSDDETLDQSGRHPSIHVDLSCNNHLSGGKSAAAGTREMISTATAPGLPPGVSVNEVTVTGGGVVVGNMADELDNLMDISMEIASNKKMKKDHIKPFKLTFKDREMEKKVIIKLLYTTYVNKL